MTLVLAYEGHSKYEWPLFVGDTFAEIDRHFHLKDGTARKSALQATRVHGMRIVKIAYEEEDKLLDLQERATEVISLANNLIANVVFGENQAS